MRKEDSMDTINKYLSGVLISLILAAISLYLGEQIPSVGGPVLALLLGMLINFLFKPNIGLGPGLDFTSKKLLKFAIILLGFSLNIGQILEVGKISLVVMVFTLASAFGFGYIFGKLFKMDWRLSSLISAGTGICGGSAVAALSPVIEAEDSQVAYAISATFIFDIAMILLFPIMGRCLELSDMAYGLWTGTAVNDTSSVVAAGYAYSDAAGKFATIVKLTRTLSILPTVIIFSFITHRKKEKVGREKYHGHKALGKQTISFKEIFPYFIVLFVVASIINSTGFISPGLNLILSRTSKFIMVMALGAIGLKTNLREIKNSGFYPMIHGFIISAIVVIVSLGVQIMLGQV